MGDTLGSGCQFGVAKFNQKEGRALFFHLRKNQGCLKLMFAHRGTPHWLNAALIKKTNKKKLKLICIFLSRK